MLEPTPLLMGIKMKTSVHHEPVGLHYESSICIVILNELMVHTVPSYLSPKI